MTAGRRAATILAACAALAAPVRAAAQPVLSPTEHIDFNRPEAWALKYFSSVTLFTGLEAPGTPAPGSIVLGVEFGWVPPLDETQRRVGFEGTKPEDLNKTPLFVRPRVTIGLPHGYSLIVAVPLPVTVFGVKPLLFAIALQRNIVDAGGWRIGLRGGGQFGNVQGAYTCPEEVLAFPPGSAGNLYGCQAVSSDTATLGFLSAEAIMAYKPGARFSPHVAVAVNYLDLGFQVDALTFGYIDHTHLLTHGVTVAASGGLTVALGGGFAVSGDVFYTPLWVQRPDVPLANEGLLNLRALLSYRLH